MEAEEEALKSQLEDAELQKRKLDDQIVKESEKAEKLDEELERYSDILLFVVITTTVKLCVLGKYKPVAAINFRFLGICCVHQGLTDTPCLRDVDAQWYI